MSDKIRTSLLSLAIITVMVFSAVRPTNAYADGGTPPEETPAEVTDNPTEDSTEGSGEEATSAEAAADSEPAEVAGAEGEAAPASDSTVLDGVPDQTSVTVLDANGEAQPLATQEAAEAIAMSDPIWCPGTQQPTPGENGCTDSFTSFDGLLSFLSGNTDYQGAGTIYIEQGEYRGNDPNKVIDFNSPAYNLSNINTSTLNVTGGWNISNNTIEPTRPSTFSNYSILIGSSGDPWVGTVTISNIVMNLEGVTDPSVNGLTVHSDGSIQLDNVQVWLAPNHGAELHAGRDVNIRNSKFMRNQVTGALIRSRANVSIANSEFGNPQSDAGRRQNFGLDVESAQFTSLFGVIANNNREAGATIDAGNRVIIGQSFFSGTKERLGPRSAPVFLGYGLQIVTDDSVDIDRVTANDNFLWGALVDAGGDINISNSEFNENSTDEPGFIDDTGLFITRGQSVSLDHVTASNNRLYGAQITVDGTVSIRNSLFNNNRGVITVGGQTNYHGHGLQINTLSSIFIDRTEAVNNMLFGGELTAGGEVAVSNSSFSDTSTSLADVEMGKGLEITSAGNASLASVILDNNQTVGADIQAGGDVFLDMVTATNNVEDGVAVQTSCTHIFGGLYSGNGGYGLNLGSSALDVMSPAIFTGNDAGGIFPENPPTCSFVFGGGAPAPNNGAAAGGSPAPVTGESVGSSSLFTAAVTSAAGTVSSEKTDLNTYMAHTKTGRTGSHGIFIGKYVYVHSTEGLQIFALVPDAQVLAMDSP